MAMSTLGVIANFVGILLFLFFFWRRLKEDYTSNQIFVSSFYIIFATLGLALITQFLLIPKLGSNAVFLKDGLWFWAGAAGATLATTVSILRFRLRVFETLEAVTLGLAFWLLVVFTADAFGRYQIASLVAAVIISFLIIGFFFLDSHYREFTWYRSGKIGFTGLVTLGTFFLLRALLAIFFPSVLSFIGKFDALISATAGFISFFSVYHLSQST